METELASMGLTVDEQKLVEDFRRDVVEPSMTQLVVLDFWAEWCGPCKALTPLLEKVTAEYADRGVVLAKVNVDENGFIASQFQVRSIPTVYAMFQGQPVADLTQARTESQLKSMLDQILAKLPVQPTGEPAPDLPPLLAMGEEALAEGDAIRATSIFAQIVEIAPDSAAAQAGLVRALAASGAVQDAEAHLASLPDTLTKDPLFDRARSALALAQAAGDPGEIAALEAALAADDDAHETRFALANAHLAAGDRDAAATHLLALIAKDREWNEGAAKTRLLQIFESIGLTDPWVSATRRKLSAVLFG